MDDDAVPEPEALETLVRAATNRNNVYASVACDGDRLSWAMTLAGTGNSASQGSGLRIRSFGALPAHPEVEFAPFLGFLVHTDLVKRIGLPEAGYFVAADDVEYCLRARKHGSRIILVPQSRLCHPVSDSHSVNLFGTEIICLKLPPWKRYYDTRNRLLLARKHYGAAFYYKTIPATFVRLVAVIWREPRRIAQCHAFVAGFVDGLLGKRGCRHSMWQIAQ
jgi:GT2 family glycosyltransferase